ncbi:MAG TPA: DMT family transporter [Ramlibacter sp.]|uniref:DMT family transporter n=1 Tax=Ramlibacter sp. TaxID=1917967 RepID=UPI002CE7E4A1|nr:DMT family transporter [Ramlibacter sp.]HVZ45303.1 DMT family transporter [Ramlibacter sp.]
MTAASAQERSRAGGLAFAICGAIAFSGKAIIVKLAYRYGTDAVTLIMLRMLFALPLFAAMAWWASRGQARLAMRDWAGAIGLGVIGYYLSSFLDFLGLRYVTASLERLIMYVTPTLVLLLGWLLHGKRWQRRHVIGIAISYTGVVLVFGQELHVEGSNVALGTFFVFASTITYALYLVYSAQVVQRLGSMRLVGLATSVACVCAIAQYFALRTPAALLAVPMPVVWLSVLNAVLCTAVPVLLVMMAVERVGPAVTSQSGMIGPVSTILMGVVLLGEPFTGWIAAGTAFVIAGIFVFTSSSRTRA